MYIILGASGQVGSAVVAGLLKQDQAVKAIIRDEAKAGKLTQLGAKIAVANAADLPSLSTALQGGDTLFVLTPEDEKSPDIINETKNILANYRKAAANAGIKKIVGLSSVGAQHQAGTGNLQLSYMLEHAFTGLEMQQVFIRPAYYFSNWMPYLNIVKEQGVLPTFFPADMVLPMVSPMDVAKLITRELTDKDTADKIYEIEGPARYTSTDVAQAFADTLRTSVTAEQIPHDKWEETLKGIGFSSDGIKKFIEMTDAVINGKAQPQGQGTIRIKGATALQDYIRSAIK